jgi:type IV secretory pathway TraG/TraD family ATPase VirD4
MAQQHPHGRLPVPIVCVLDEVANVCRWQGLPAQFSHYGSAGIFLVAILQNWSQGIGAWKQAGMQQLWDAATIRLVGAGIADRAHLGDIAQLIGERFTPRKSSGISTGGKSSRSVNTSFDRELILSIDELAGLPSGRMIVIPSGEYPILARTVPWFRRPVMADKVATSIATYEPAGVK